MTSAARSPRRTAWASEVARKEHAAHRRRLAKQAATRAAQTLDHARNELATAERRERGREINRRINSVANGLRPRLGAVMNSWGVTLPFEISPASRISAYTDFRKIVVRFVDDDATGASNLEPWQSHHSWDPQVVVPSLEDQRRLAAEIRGLFYHEVGHNLVTVPILDLLNRAVAEGWVPPPAAADDQPLVSITDLAKAQWSVHGVFKMIWNAFEDQRMEQWLVAESPQVAAYLTVLLCGRIIPEGAQNRQWLLVAGREYLPSQVRLASKAAWDLKVPGLTADDLRLAVRQYCRAVTAREMIEIVHRIASAWVAVDQRYEKTGVDEHDMMRARGGWAPDAPKDDQSDPIRDVGQRIAEKQDEDEQESTRPTWVPILDTDDETSDDETSDDEPAHETSDDALPEPGVDRANRGVGTGLDQDPLSGPTTPPVPETVDDVLQALEDDETLTDDVKAINSAAATDTGSLPLYGDFAENTDEHVVSQVHGVVDDIVRAFQNATADSQPVWQSLQRRGVVEPVRWVTRQPGDLEVFRSWADEGDPGHDVAVSLFLDVSSSMAGSGSTLGATAWAVKQACIDLDIECDVSLFNHGGYTLWGVGDQPDFIPSLSTIGGTDPSTAFEGILATQRPHRHHIVLVMTDGVWDDLKALVPFLHPNVHSLLFFYNGYAQCRDATPDPVMAERHGVQEAYVITDLLDIPVALEHLLLSLVG